MTQSRSHTKPTKRPYRNAEYWRQLIDVFETSNLSANDFCAQHGIKYATFYKWRKQLQQAETDNKTPSFIELTDLTKQAPANQPIWDIELELSSGTYLRIRRV